MTEDNRIQLNVPPEEFTVGVVQDLLENLESLVGDNEVAHGFEDVLYITTLTAIAEGAPQPRKLAREALKAQDIDYQRWYA